MKRIPSSHRTKHGLSRNFHGCGPVPYLPAAHTQHLDEGRL